MKNSATKSNRINEVEELHWESTTWKSQFLHMEDELLFIERLLNSYVFEPNTPNLFERLMDYKSRIKEVCKRKDEVVTTLSEHESQLGGMLERDDRFCDQVYFGKHDEIKSEVKECLGDFQNLKAEIFNYAGSILRKHKPDKKA